MDPGRLLKGVRRRIGPRVRRAADALYYRAAFAAAVLRNRRVGRAYVGPDRVTHHYTIWKTCRLLGLRMRHVPDGSWDVAVAWRDETRCAPHPVPDALNARCVDIGKDLVQRRFAEAFGYTLAVDPRTQEGPYVRKSVRNYAHDGVVLAAPSMREPGFVYERLIDTIDADGYATDLRTPIVGDSIPLVWTLKRPVRDRFGTDSPYARRVSTSDVYTADEVRKLLAFARSLGLAYGELDVLRDRSDGRIYVVDANKTPVGPPPALAAHQRYASMHRIAHAFEREFLRRIRPSSYEVGDEGSRRYADEARTSSRLPTSMRG